MKFSIAGTDIARVLDNALLFVGNAKALRLPQVVLVRLSETGISFAGTDDYAVAEDRIGEPGAESTRFELAEDQADALVKFARSQRRKTVDIHFESTDRDRGGRVLYVRSGPDLEGLALPVTPARGLWENFLDLLTREPTEEPLPSALAFAPERFMRFGRVKTVSAAPVDVWLEPSGKAPLAHFKIGPTFVGALQAIERAQAAVTLGELAEDSLWLPAD